MSLKIVISELSQGKLYLAKRLTVVIIFNIIKVSSTNYIYVLETLHLC